jgi:microcystin-dependent protein
MAQPFIGEVRIFAGNFAPRDWAFCSGQLLPIAQNTALFAILGTTFGGDGRTTVGLPNLDGRAPMHAGNGPGLTNRRLGEGGGTTDVLLTEANMPPHDHAMEGSVRVANQDDPGNQAWTAVPVGNTLYGPPNNLVDMAPEALLGVGGGQSHNNMQPFLTLNFIIAIVGQFPSRT